jgi:lactate dehydrogenase-like 2-hydroxyacid dehydrogenase
VVREGAAVRVREGVRHGAAQARLFVEVRDRVRRGDCRRLLSLDTVVLLPHVASGPPQRCQAMSDLLLQNLGQFLSDGSR